MPTRRSTRGRKIAARRKVVCSQCGARFSSPPNGDCPTCGGTLNQLPPVGKAHGSKKIMKDEVPQ